MLAFGAAREADKCSNCVGYRMKECKRENYRSRKRKKGREKGRKGKKELFSSVVTQSASFERRLRIIVQLFLH